MTKDILHLYGIIGDTKLTIDQKKNHISVYVNDYLGGKYPKNKIILEFMMQPTKFIKDQLKIIRDYNKILEEEEANRLKTEEQYKKEISEEAEKVEKLGTEEFDVEQLPPSVVDRHSEIYPEIEYDEFEDPVPPEQPLPVNIEAKPNFVRSTVPPEVIKELKKSKEPTQEAAAAVEQAEKVEIAKDKKELKEEDKSDIAGAKVPESTAVIKNKLIKFVDNVINYHEVDNVDKVIKDYRVGDKASKINKDMLEDYKKMRRKQIRNIYVDYLRENVKKSNINELSFTDIPYKDVKKQINAVNKEFAGAIRTAPEQSLFEDSSLESSESFDPSEYARPSSSSLLSGVLGYFQGKKPDTDSETDLARDSITGDYSTDDSTITEKSGKGLYHFNVDDLRNKRYFNPKKKYGSRNYKPLFDYGGIKLSGNGVEALIRENPTNKISKDEMDVIGHYYCANNMTVSPCKANIVFGDYRFTSPKETKKHLDTMLGLMVAGNRSVRNINDILKAAAILYKHKKLSKKAYCAVLNKVHKYI